jgi:hypothetical protein
MKSNRWVKSDIQIEKLIEILRIDKLGVPYVRELFDCPNFYLAHSADKMADFRAEGNANFYLAHSADKMADFRPAENANKNTENNYAVLLNRQRLLQQLHQDYLDTVGSETVAFADTAASLLNQDADIILWYFKLHDKETKELYDSLFYSWDYIEQYLNSSSKILSVTTFSKIYLLPVLTILGPVLSSLIPIIAMKWYGLDISYATAFKIVWKGLVMQITSAVNAILNNKSIWIVLAVLLYLVFYIYGIWSTIQTSLEKYYHLCDIRGKISGVRRFLLNMRLVLTHPQNRYFKNTSLLANNIDNLLQEFGTESSIGADMCMFRKLFTKHSSSWIQFVQVVEYAREIVGNISLSRVLRRQNFCLPKWYANQTPVIDIKGLWHPLLPYKSAVPNDIRLSQNVLITGPNQAGKSTFLRAALTAVWMAHTVGIVPATSFDATPLDLIYSYIGVTDEIGKESLFQAEMNSVHQYLNDISKGKIKGICFFDELFTSTNHEEGVSAALAVCTSLSHIKNGITVISSHFTELSRSDFEKYHFEIVESNQIADFLPSAKNADFLPDVKGKIKFSYKLKPGLSKQRVALRLMKEKGYAESIVTQAYSNLKELFPNSLNFSHNSKTQVEQTMPTNIGETSTKVICEAQIKTPNNLKPEQEKEAQTVSEAKVVVEPVVLFDPQRSQPLSEPPDLYQCT